MRLKLSVESFRSLLRPRALVIVAVVVTDRQVVVRALVVQVVAPVDVRRPLLELTTSISDDHPNS